MKCKKCGSEDCIRYTERGLSGMTTYWVYPCEVKKMREKYGM